MKKLTTTLLLLGSLTLGFSDTTDTQAIDAQTQERTQKMNEMKEKIAQMPAKEREAKLQQMQKEMSQEASRVQTKTQKQERVREMQMQNSNQMLQNQSMSQHQAGSQFKHATSGAQNSAKGKMPSQWMQKP